MKPDDSQVSDQELQAYVDGELDERARAHVQQQLAQNPLQAAQVMADLAAMQALRDAFGEDGPAPSAALAASARRLEKGLAGRRRARRLLQAAAMAALFVGGWALGAARLVSWPSLGQPEFVDEAVESHQTALLRARMESQPEVASYDPNEIRAATRINIPAVPRDWRVTDAQVFPSDEGPSVGLAFATAAGPVSLFGYHTEDAAEIAPTLVRRDREYVAYWQSGDLAYALIGTSNPRRLERVAARLAEASEAGRAS